MPFPRYISKPDPNRLKLTRYQLVNQVLHFQGMGAQLLVSLHAPQIKINKLYIYQLNILFLAYACEHWSAVFILAVGSGVIWKQNSAHREIENLDRLIAQLTAPQKEHELSMDNLNESPKGRNTQMGQAFSTCEDAIMKAFSGELAIFEHRAKQIASDVVNSNPVKENSVLGGKNPVCEK